MIHEITNYTNVMRIGQDKIVRHLLTESLKRNTLFALPRSRLSALVGRPSRCLAKCNLAQYKIWLIIVHQQRWGANIQGLKRHAKPNAIFCEVIKI